VDPVYLKFLQISIFITESLQRPEPRQCRRFGGGCFGGFLLGGLCLPAVCLSWSLPFLQV
jgi:hypothetical protein